MSPYERRLREQRGLHIEEPAPRPITVHPERLSALQVMATFVVLGQIFDAQQAAANRHRGVKR